MASRLCRRLAPVACKICNFSQVTRAPIARFSQIHKLNNVAIATWRQFSSTQPQSHKETVTLNFTLSNGEKCHVKAKVGDNLLDIIVENDLDIDGFGACEGTLACSTCHLIFKPEDFEKIEEKPTDEELDMLDLAYGLSDTSRLGCQVIVTKEMENWEIKVPTGVADARDV